MAHTSVSLCLYKKVGLTLPVSWVILSCDDPGVATLDSKAFLKWYFFCLQSVDGVVER